MSDSTETIFLILDAQKGRDEVADFQNQVDMVDKEWQAKRRKMLGEISRAAMATTAVITIVRGAFKTFGLTLDPLLEVIFTMIASFVGPMQLLAASLTATGLGAAAGVALAAVSIFVAGATAALAIQGMDEAKERMAGIDQALGGLETIARTYGGFT